MCPRMRSDAPRAEREEPALDSPLSALGLQATGRRWISSSTNGFCWNTPAFSCRPNRTPWSRTSARPCRASRRILSKRWVCRGSEQESGDRDQESVKRGLLSQVYPSWKTALQEESPIGSRISSMSFKRFWIGIEEECESL